MYTSLENCTILAHDDHLIILYVCIKNNFKYRASSVTYKDIMMQNYIFLLVLLFN